MSHLFHPRQLKHVPSPQGGTPRRIQARIALARTSLELASLVNEQTIPSPPMRKTFTPETPHSPSYHSRHLSQALTALASIATFSTGLMARADDEGPASRVNALLNFELSTHYLTPRGMIVQDSGLVFQPLVLGFFNLYKGEGFINSATLVGGVWNCFGTERIASSDSNGTDNTSWYEIDPIAGLSFGVAKHLTVDVTYTSFNMQIKNIPFSHHLETKLSLDDSAWLGKFALHPYLIFWSELDGKATAAQVPYLVDPLGKGPQPLPGSSWYFDVGITPGYTFEKSGLKLEAPLRMLIPDSEFYGEYYAESETIALYEAGAKATLPLKFMPKGYGNWSFHAGVKYQYFADENLASMQAFNAPAERTTDVVQFYCGFSTFF